MITLLALIIAWLIGFIITYYINKLIEYKTVNRDWDWILLHLFLCLFMWPLILFLIIICKTIEFLNNIITKNDPPKWL